MFGWLLRIFRKLEKSLEKKIEGQDSGVNPHYLEASRAAQRIMLDNKVKIDGRVFIPNLILVPFSKAKKVPDSYVSNLIENVKNSTEANVYKTLAPFAVHSVRAENCFSEVDMAWSDQNENVAVGIVECCQGPLEGQIWGIPLEGAVIGRGKGTDIHIEADEKMSRLHLQVSVSVDDQIVVQDLGSRNGTFIRNKAIATKKNIKRSSGVEIRAGVSSFKCYALPGQVKYWS